MVYALVGKAVIEVVYCTSGDSVAMDVLYNFFNYSFIASACMMFVFVMFRVKDIPLWVDRIKLPLIYIAHLLGIYYWWYAFVEITYIADSREVYEAGESLSWYHLILLACMAIYSYIKIYKFKNMKPIRTWI